jgi:hypothetical protein
MRHRTRRLSPRVRRVGGGDAHDQLLEAVTIAASFPMKAYMSNM